MKKILLITALFLLTFKIAEAHNPLSAMYYLEVEGDFGILNISLSQAGLDQALIASFPNKDISKISNEEYKKLAVAYIKDHFQLAVNNEDVNILNGGIKLGNHQTDLKFITSVVPESFNSIDLKIDAFKENDHHQTIFSLLLNGETSKVVLSDSNDYTTSKVFRNNLMITDNQKFNANYLWFIAVIPVVVFGRKFLPSSKSIT
jgi:hypothetical protein